MQNVENYFFKFVFVLFLFCFLLHFANATCRNAFFFYKFLHLALCHTLLWKKTPFQTTPYLKFSWKSYTFFSHFCRFRYMYWVIWVTRSALKTIPFYSVFRTYMLAQETSEWVHLGDTENHYETYFWSAVDFNNLKCISFIKCRWILDDL